MQGWRGKERREENRGEERRGPGERCGAGARSDVPKQEKGR